MNNYDREYKELLKQKKDLLFEIKLLEDTSIVKDYIKLRQAIMDLNNEISELHKKIIINDIASCNHIMVYTDDNASCCGCIKCGLDNRVLDKNKDELTEDELIIYNYLKKKNITSKTINSNIVCNLNLARSIYQELLEDNPLIEDREALEKFATRLSEINKTFNLETEEKEKILSFNKKNK
jgi:hypothetical protein